ncbi:hypothetical protein Cantr_04484 [Candida viswanathii]|uniref:DUF202 domain-containing protein n=1 Tax=Candida viswanathii TaxID=5486 RepID=A0A367XND3_9ASCO|nr:hypothetical protein Cantr_04484 [Candida viswanathii]
METKPEISREMTNECSPEQQQQQQLLPMQQPPAPADADSRNWSNLEYLNFQITLKNKSSVARDHMANERTLLSWLRTALTFLTFGVGFLQFYRMEIKTPNTTMEGKIIERLSRPIGILCVVLSVTTVCFGSFRYFQVQNALLIDNYPATRLTIVVLILINLSMLILLMVMDIKISIL